MLRRRHVLTLLFFCFVRMSHQLVQPRLLHAQGARPKLARSTPERPSALALPRLWRLRGGTYDSEEEDGEDAGEHEAHRSGKTGSGVLQDVPERIEFPQMEEQILDYWDDIGALEQSEAMARAEKRKPWIFFDGPPFATGMPHYGHILAGTIKDVVTRFWSQNGRLVERKWGWDCHGLPVEYEIEQALGIKSREDVLKMGIPAFNAECRRVVMRYASEWKRVVRRLARWIDMDKGYKTLDTPYMESVWWTCQQLFNKKLLYRGVKVMPYSTGCMTSLSNFEANLNYKEVSDPAIMVRMPLVAEEGEARDEERYLVIWTTTPWTLPSNLALCVNPDAEYVEVEDIKSGAHLIVMGARLSQLYGKHAGTSCRVVRTMPGRHLVGRRYLPPFDILAHYRHRGAFRVLGDGYVSDESGTGVVHLAAGFGEEDMRICCEHGIVDKKAEASDLSPIDHKGCLTVDIPRLRGLYLKDADAVVIEMLKQTRRLEGTKAQVLRLPLSPPRSHPRSPPPTRPPSTPPTLLA
jgi:isoleucyl-tRNA synthetase